MKRDFMQESFEYKEKMDLVSGLDSQGLYQVADQLTDLVTSLTAFKISATCASMTDGGTSVNWRRVAEFVLTLNKHYMEG